VVGVEPRLASRSSRVRLDNFTIERDKISVR
jgi:hypothetical protein